MLQVVSPFDESLLKEIPFHDKSDIEHALVTANELFSNTSKSLKPHERIAILEKVVLIMKKQERSLINTAVKEGGKPYKDTVVEVQRAINGVKLAIEGISQLKGEQVPMGLTASSENRLAFTTREPIGVVCAVSAFNHPLNLIVHQTVTAIAAGCPVIIKPALTTPLSCLSFLEILDQAELPKGWCQVIICSDELAEILVTDERINYFSFIGSAKVGWYLRSKLPPGTRCALEHGGSAPVIVEQDANLTDLLPALLKGGFYHAGQVCVAVQRVFVHESQAREIATRLAEMAKKLKVGDPMHETTEVGPLILPREVDRLELWVKEAKEEGAEILCGGYRINAYCFAPTVLLNPSANSRVTHQEIFGPIVCIYAYDHVDKAIEQANALKVHFQASVFTESLDRAMSAVKKLNASAVMVNDHTAFRVDWMPFGGRDSSGIGMGGIQQTMKEMTREKLMVIKSSSC